MTANDVGISPPAPPGSIDCSLGLGLFISRFYTHREFQQSVRTRITSRPGILTPPQHTYSQPDHLPPLSVQRTADCQNLAIYVQDGPHLHSVPGGRFPTAQSYLLYFLSCRGAGPTVSSTPQVTPASAVSKWRLELLWKMVLC